MRYEYSGYLKTVLHAPDEQAREALDCIEFTADDMAGWYPIDDDADTEWQRIPVNFRRSEEGVLLEGSFQDTRRIDNLSPDDPSFWVALSTRNWQDGRLPVNVLEYPIAELTYRCTTPRARPAWLWHYPGGVHFDGLQPSREWRTIARLVPHYGFPRQVNQVTLRLYSPSRTTEAMELRAIRFRKMNAGEAEATAKHQERLRSEAGPPHHDLLDQFLPMGVCMQAGTARRMAEILEISLEDYWRLAFEDIARHCHNSVSLEGIGELSTGEWEHVLEQAEAFGLRILARHDWPMDDFEAAGQALVDKHIRPYRGSQAILGWSLQNEPPEHTFLAHLDARKRVYEADPNHPVVALMREPNSFPLFAPFFSASGISHFKSHEPWRLGEKVAVHLERSDGQQFWVTAPTFVYATNTPEWNTVPEIRLMLNQAFARGARGWFSFTYHNDPIWLGGRCQRSLTGPFLTFSDLWSELGHRISRFAAMTPLFLQAHPTDHPPLDISLDVGTHARSKRPEHVPPVEMCWLRGSDYDLLYILSNDISEVTAVYLRLPEDMAPDLGVYDVTDFLRGAPWAPMEQHRHLEMFPGQGQLLLIAPEPVCTRWRDLLATQLTRLNRQQLGIDIDLARHYSLHVQELEAQAERLGGQSPLEGLAESRRLHDALTNAIYSAPEISEARSALIRGSAAICGCDGALCRMLGAGRIDQAHELGLRLLPHAQHLSRLRVRLRAGEGAQIRDDCDALARQILVLLEEIRNLR